MSSFTIIPAIDLKDGQCVRLQQGRADEVKVYSADPVAVAQRWVEEGAAWLHVVDLDGAFTGHPVHGEVIGQIVKAVSVPVQAGGGLRTDVDIEAWLKLGVRRVVLGTRALQDAAGLGRAVQRYGGKLAVGIDAREGRVQIRGWTETTCQSAVDLARQAEQLGVQTIIYTDTARDGMLSGVNAEALQNICAAVRCAVIASGGLTSVEDVKILRKLNCSNLIGAIVGKALYEGRVTLRALQDTGIKG